MNKKAFYHLIAATIFPFALLIYGCATILKGGIDQVDVSSEPNGAKVYINGHMLGRTPVTLKLAAQKTYYIEFEKDGYERRTYVLTSSVGAGWIVLDVLFGLVPVVVDAATGNWYEFDENNAGVYLERQKGVTIQPSAELQVPSDIEPSDKAGKVGLRLGRDGIIVELAENMPAQEAGIHVGDRLLKIDGKGIFVDNFDATLEMLDGLPDTKVELTIQRDSQQLVFKLTRKTY
jgi:PEGA domain/PDZ domain